MKHLYISPKTKKKLPDNNLNIFIYLLLLLVVFFTPLLINTLNAQQVIGICPEVNGSFSNQTSPLTQANPFTPPQTNWTTEITNKGIVKSTGGRSNPKYLQFTQNGTTSRKLYTPTMGTKIKKNTAYTIQFYAKGDMDGSLTNNQELKVSISPDGTNNLSSTLWLYDNDTAYVDWTLFSFTLTTANVTETNGLVILEAENDRLIYIDDFVIYPGSFDVTPPNDPDTLIVGTTSFTSINLSWTPPQGGLDSGGYVLVRYKVKPEDNDDVNFKGIYNVGDTVFGSNQGKVVYIGTGTSFLDNSGLSSNSEYWYKLYAVDKAFNYSGGRVVEAYTLNIYPQMTIVQNIHDFGLVPVGGMSAEQAYTVSGINLLDTVFIASPAPFKISKTSGSGFTSSIKLVPIAGVLTSTTIYVRFDPVITGLTSASILNKTFGTGNILINVTGTGYKGAPTVQASNINCTEIGPRSLNVNWTDGNGDRRLVKINTTNSFTDPVDSTYPADNAKYSGTGEQVVYKGFDATFNAYGLSPLSHYWFKVYEYNNTDTLTKYKTTTYTLNPNTCMSGTMSDFFEDFELGSLDYYYADTLLTLESGKWHFAKADIGTQQSDKKRGGKAARILKGGYIAMNFDKPNGIDTITIYNANYRSDQNGMFMVQYSTDQGLHFHSLATVTCAANGALQKTSIPALIQGSVRLVINVINGDRVDIDDIAFNDYILTTWTGYSNTDWSNHNNWDNGVPDPTKDVLIPTVPPGNPNNFPVVSATIGYCGNIKIQTGASLTINPNGALTVQGKITALDSLIILSDATGTGSLITNGSVSGTTHFYKYISGGNKTNFVSTPLSNALSGVFSAGTPADTLKYFNEPATTPPYWTKILNNTTALTPVMRGYCFKRPGTGTVVFSGNLNNYNENITLTRTTSSAYKGFNLIGNPYPSGINWNSDSLNTGSFAHKTYWTNANESFATYNGNAKIGCPVTINNIIPPTESFFVKLNAPLTTFNFAVSNYTRKHPIDTPDSSSLNPNIFRLMVNQQSQMSTDEIALAFFTTATDTFDIFDSEKLFSFNNTVPQIYTQFQTNKIAINSSTPITHFKSFPLGFKAPVAGNYVLTPKLNEYDVSLPVFLKDKLVHDSLTDLRTVSQYNFSSLLVSGDTNRFDLLFYPCYFTQYTFTYDTTYCEASGGVDIKLNGSETNVKYQLYKNGVIIGSAQNGTGSALIWHNMLNGTYTVKATSTVIPSCFTNFNDTAIVKQIALPIAYTFEPVSGNTYCQGSTGTSIHIINSQNNVHYQLFKNSISYGNLKNGNGNALEWDSLLTGTYSLVAYTTTTPVCSKTFNNSITITMTPSPATFNVTSAGSSCQGDGGWVLLQNSELGVNYQLKKNGLNIEYAHTGTGSSMQWNNLFVSGSYYIIATSTITGCSVAMNDTVQINYIMSPTAYSVTGGGSFCAGQGVVGLQNSQTTVYYQLIKDTYTNIGSPVLGTGSSLQWTNLAAGYYTISAYTSTVPSCTGNMSGVIQVVEVAAPTAYNLTGSGSFCSGGTGSVTLSGSQTGVNYQLLKGSINQGAVKNGTGGSLVWTNLTAGSYTVAATNVAAPYCAANMNGTAVITISSAPTVFNLSGGGTYCAGGSGISVTLSGSELSTAYYQLYKNGSLQGSAVDGTGSALTWSSLTAGTYTVIATYYASPNCTSNMTGSVVITSSPTPTVYNFTGSGSYCPGSTGLTATLSNSQTGINYQLKKSGVDLGSAISGTNSALTWTNLTAGTYTVVATYVASPNCTATMSGTVTITANPSPTIYNLSGGGSYCAGGTGLSITLSGSQTGISYQLQKNSVNQGSAVSGTGSSLVWNSLSGGTYTVIATYLSAPFCAATMNGSIVITQSPVPTAYNLTGSGAYCTGSSGLSVTLSGSETGINYQLKNNSVDQGSAVSGTGSSLIWNNLTSGTYTVVATYVASPNCTATMSGSVVITESLVPLTYSLTGGGTFCTGGSGLSVNLSGSQTGINYQLKNNNVDQGSAVSGTGNPMLWNNLSTGSYTVVATYVASPNCSTTMTGSVVIVENPLPTVYNLTGSGAYCVGSSGLSVTLGGSQTGINYQLKKNGANQGSAVSGTGSALVWTSQATGTYTVVATYVASPFCTSNMNGSVVITSSPVPTVFNLTGGGNYCTGGSGLSITLSGSQSGINYQLKKNNLDQGSPVSGTGGSLIWSSLSSGTYTIVATYVASPNCSANMNGSIVITENSAPTLYTLSGSGSYCTGSSGLSVTLSGSQTGINYQLKKNSANLGTAISGTGNPIVWNNLTYGTYTVLATYVASPYCSATMTGSVVITESPVPIIYNISGGGTFCTGSTGLSVTLSNSQNGINYQLKKNSVDQGSAVSGTGAALVWNNLSGGTYTVVATYVASPNCSSPMSGSVVITESPSPTVFNLAGGGSYCAGASGLSVTLNSSQTGINYQLKKNAANQGAAISGTGSALVWSSLNAGTYTVVATYVASPYCSATMNGSIVITQNSLPVANAGVNQTIPFGTYTALSATASGGSGTFSYSWAPSASVVSPNSQSTNTVNLNAITQFIVTVHDVNTSCNNTDTMIVFISGGPLNVLAVAQSNTICQNDTAFLNTLASGGTGSYTYTWSSNPAGFNATFANPIAIPTVNTTYTVSVFDGFNTQTSSTSIVVSPLPTQYTLSGNGSYCQGSSGDNISLNNSNTNVLYQLYQNGQPFGSAIHGTNTVLTWTNITIGVYTVGGTFDYVPSCAVNMLGTVTITQSPNPTVFNVTGDGTYCQGGTGLTVTLSGSQTGINYQLLKNGTPSGTPISGTGSLLTWNNQLNGDYTVTAAYTSSPFCSSAMNGTAVINQSSSPTVFTLTGGGSYCAGGTGLSVTLSGSQTSINYQLKKNGADFGNPVSGTGSALVWNNLSTATYTVVATYVASPNCSANMTGSIIITAVALPVVSAGNDVSIPYGTNTPLHATASGGSGSYAYLWQPSSSVASPTLQNTNTLNLTSQTQFIVHVNDQAAPYCANTDTVVVTVTGSALSVTATVAPDTICLGDTVFLNAIATGGSGTYTYIWSSVPAGFTSTVHNPYATPTISTNYTVVVNDNYNNASNNIAVVVRPLPQSFTLSSGGYYCYGSGFSITLSGSQPNVSYQLYKNGSPSGAMLSGTGNPLTWNNLLSGTYTAEAFLSNPPQCSKAMQGTAIVNQYQQTNIVFNSIPQNCVSNTIQPLAATPAGGTFSGNGVTGNNFSATVAGVGNHTITYSYTDGNGCLATSQQSALVNALPVVTLSNPDDICTSAPTFLLYGGLPSGGTYSGSGIASDSLHPTSLSIGIHNVIYTYVDGNSCINSDTATIKINGFPLAYNMSSIGYYCPGTPGTNITLSSSQSGVSYQLYKDNVAFGAPVVGTGSPLVWDSIIGGQYHIWGFYTSTPDCKTFMNNALIINEATPADLHLPSDTTLCQNQIILLSVHVGYTYNWVQLPTDTLSHNNTLLVDTAVNNGLGTHTYVAWLIDNHNCISVDSINITFDACDYVINSPDFNIVIYPNPSSDLLNIDFQSMKNGNYKIEFVNMLGQTTFEKAFNIQSSDYKLKTNVSKFVKGVYQINIYYDNHVIVNKKFVVN